MSAYYNEIDPYAAQWLRNLIAAGHIAAGDVDERSIVDVAPSELVGYTQCHFFAGIGVWSLALRRAGWADDWPIWTGSCPCQPFSAAGKGAGFDDERHLWPAFHHLIKECRPAVVLGEQVASKDANPWLDLVQDDLEALGYAFGAVAFPSAGVGAPHIRDRLYWVADAGLDHDAGEVTAASARQSQADRPADQLGGCGTSPCGLADAYRGQFDGVAIVGGNERVGHDAGRTQECCEPQSCGDLCGLADANDRSKHALLRGAKDDPTQDVRRCAAGGSLGHLARGIGSESERLRDAGERPGPTNGLWRNADWLLCRDGKWRPVEPGTFPLAHGAPARVGRLRAYGNAINAEAARVWIETVMECIP